MSSRLQAAAHALNLLIGLLGRARGAGPRVKLTMEKGRNAAENGEKWWENGGKMEKNAGKMKQIVDK